MIGSEATKVRTNDIYEKDKWVDIRITTVDRSSVRGLITKCSRTANTNKSDVALKKCVRDEDSKIPKTCNDTRRSREFSSGMIDKMLDRERTEKKKEKRNAVK